MANGDELKKNGSWFNWGKWFLIPIITLLMSYAGVKASFVYLENRVEKMEVKVESHSLQVNTVETKLEGIEKKLDSIENKIDRWGRP